MLRSSSSSRVFVTCNSSGRDVHKRYSSMIEVVTGAGVVVVSVSPSFSDSERNVDKIVLIVSEGLQFFLVSYIVTLMWFIINLMSSYLLMHAN